MHILPVITTHWTAILLPKLVITAHQNQVGGKLNHYLNSDFGFCVDGVPVNGASLGDVCSSVL